MIVNKRINKEVSLGGDMKHFLYGVRYPGSTATNQIKMKIKPKTKQHVSHVEIFNILNLSFFFFILPFFSIKNFEVSF